MTLLGQDECAGRRDVPDLFDPNGRLTNRWQAGNIATTYKFDPVGNLTNLVYPNSGSIVLGYDYANRLTNMVDGVGTTKFRWTVKR